MDSTDLSVTLSLRSNSSRLGQWFGRINICVQLAVGLCYVGERFIDLSPEVLRKLEEQSSDIELFGHWWYLGWDGDGARNALGAPIIEQLPETDYVCSAAIDQTSQP